MSATFVSCGSAQGDRARGLIDLPILIRLLGRVAAAYVAARQPYLPYLPYPPQLIGTIRAMHVPMPAEPSRRRGEIVVPLNADPFALEDFAPESAPESNPELAREFAPEPTPAPAPSEPAVSTDQFRFPNELGADQFFLRSSENGPVVANRRQALSSVPYAKPLMLAFAAVALVVLSGIGGYLTVSSGRVTRVPEETATVRTDEPLGTTGTVVDLNGSWEVMNRVEDSSYAAYQGLRLGYRLHLQQDGDRVTGRGEKLSENGRSIPAAAQSRVELNGTINGEKVTLAFTEHGARRSSVGTFDLQWADEGVLRGRFESDAARSRGTTVARKVAAGRSL